MTAGRAIVARETGSRRRLTWRRRGPGIYESADGRFRVEDVNRCETGRPSWQLLGADDTEPGGWCWWQTFATKGDAQDVADQYA
jgi:hypothetical protein